MDDLDSIAHRFAHQHQAYELVCWEPCGIPLYAVNADLLLQREKPIPPLDEHLLESVDAGLALLPDLRDFLGLEDHVLNHAVTRLITVDLLAFGASGLDHQPQLSVTSLGSRALAEARTSAPSREPYRFLFDRVLWRPIFGLHSDALSARDAEMAGLRRLPRADRRQITPADVRAEDLSRLIRRVSGVQASREGVEVMTVASIIRQDARYLPALLLTFAEIDGPGLRHEIALNGGLSAPHADALLRQGQAEVLGRQTDPARQPRLPRLSCKVTSIEQVREMSAKRSLEQRSGGGEPSDHSVLGLPAINDARALETFEHRLVAKQALRTAGHQITVHTSVITSAGLRQWQEDLQSALNRGVSISITTDPSEGAEDSDAEALADLERLALEHASLSISRARESRSNILLWDDFGLVSSWPLLGGDHMKQSFRREAGVIFRDMEAVERTRERLTTGRS